MSAAGAGSTSGLAEPAPLQPLPSSWMGADYEPSAAAELEANYEGNPSWAHTPQHAPPPSMPAQQQQPQHGGMDWAQQPNNAAAGNRRGRRAKRGRGFGAQ